MGDLREVRADSGACASNSLAYHGDQVLRHAVEIELELAVLVNRAECCDRRGPAAPLAKAFAPELHIPGGEACEPIAIGHHHAHFDAAFLGKPDGNSRAERRRDVLRRVHREQSSNYSLSALALRFDIES